ncbi:benzoate/H(+) symporter BenE family transporter [Aestuariibacter halophilus]|uniref:Benzoate/H(+) symporter BenE family transporter n=1 Tax=Fluctibacter halophilus TaxID=226011 RepID=A0ABS8GC53_9ALTE|nr:benzoate/H(+) symporter BenE family transporter [Aestuariibacter halophilus]MCC2618140.1 benzoate/H(+) symporter BenE family transporter [Aestuariibacter halophilus]
MQNDLSLSAITAGFMAVVIGFASAMAIVFQAASAAGATAQVMASWVWALGIGMGVGSFALSWVYKRPLIIAWSTPGAALLAVSLGGYSLAQATGTFVMVGVMLLATGLSGLSDTLTRRIPPALGGAMLAGILLQFGLKTFSAMATAPWMVGAMVVCYIVLKGWRPRLAIVGVLVLGVCWTLVDGRLSDAEWVWGLTTPVWITPEFSLQAWLGIALPLYIVTMTAQNLPGVTVLKTTGYADQPVSPLITTTGGLTTLLAPFGGFTFNLAAITAAICTSEEAHPDPAKRYVAGLSAGVFNVLAGLGGVTVVSLFAALPVEMIAALAGLALLPVIGHALHTALQTPDSRDAALITFLITASGVNFADIAAPFWGIVTGIIVQLWMEKQRRYVS